MECSYIDVCVICCPLMCTPSCLSCKVICKWGSIMSFHIGVHSYYRDSWGNKKECIEIGALSSRISDKL